MANVSWQLFPNQGSHYDPQVTGLITALVAVGYQAVRSAWANPVDRGRVNPNVPNPGQFDRVLVAIELGGSAEDLARATDFAPVRGLNSDNYFCRSTTTRTAGSSV